MLKIDNMETYKAALQKIYKYVLQPILLLLAYIPFLFSLMAISQGSDISVWRGSDLGHYFFALTCVLTLSFAINTLNEKIGYFIIFIILFITLLDQFNVSDTVTTLKYFLSLYKSDKIMNIMTALTPYVLIYLICVFPFFIFGFIGKRFRIIMLSLILLYAFFYIDIYKNVFYDEPKYMLKRAHETAENHPYCLLKGNRKLLFQSTAYKEPIKEFQTIKTLRDASIFSKRNNRRQGANNIYLLVKNKECAFGHCLLTWEENFIDNIGSGISRWYWRGEKEAQFFKKYDFQNKDFEMLYKKCGLDKEFHKKIKFNLWDYIL